MAENMWGKQPPSGASNPPPEPNTPSFWGPAPVPPKVYTFWDEIFGEGRDAEEYVPQEGVEPQMFHDSWVGGYRRGATNGPLPWGEGRDAEDPESPEGREPLGEHDSWVGGDRIGAENGPLPGGEGRGSEHEAPEGREPLGEHDSWVGGDRIGAENGPLPGGEGRGSEHEAPEGREPLGEHDSWVGGDRIGAENDSFLNTGGDPTEESNDPNEIDPEGNYRAGAREQGPGGPDSWVGGEGLGATNGPLPSGEGRGSEHEAPEGREPTGGHDSWVSRFNSGAENGPLPFGEGRDATAPEEPEPYEPLGLHESWLGGYSRGAENGPLPWGTWDEKSPLEGNIGERETREAEEVENDPNEVDASGRYRAGGREVDLGTHDSWVSRFNVGAENGELPSGSGVSGSYSPPPFDNESVSIPPFSSAPVPSGSNRVDPFVGQWNFRVEIDNVPAENCKLLSVSGVTTETEPIQYKFNTDAHMQSIPGRYKFGDVELTKVHRVNGDEFYAWRTNIENGIDDFRTVAIHLHHINMDDGPVMTMILHDAYPVKWEAPELNASSSDGAIEKITLSVTKITRGF